MERVLAELIRRGRSSADFVVISSTLAPELRSLVEWHRVPVPQRPFPLKFTVFFGFAALRLLRANAHVVHTLGAIVPSRATIASVHFCHAGYRDATGRLAPPELSLARRLNTALGRRLALAAERWCYRQGRTDILAAVSEGIVRELRTHFAHVRVELTPNGVDAERFFPDAVGGAEFRAELDVGSEEVVALFVGSDWERKGLAVAIAGLAQARALGVEGLSLWVVGSGRQDRFEAVARRHGVLTDVRFFGQRQDAERFYRAADLLVFPSQYEAFPLVALEAAASGLPQVASPVHGIEELIGRNGEAGLLVDATPATVGAALARLAGDSALRSRMAVEARQRALVYTWDRCVESVLTLYRSSRALPAEARA